MTFQCNEFEPCKVNVHYIADPELVQEKRQDALNIIKKSNTKHAGFRKGKVPDIAIKTRMKKQLEEIVAREIVAHAYDEIVFETKMKPIGYPKVMLSELNGSRYECELLFLKKPNITLKDYKGMEIPKPHMDENVSDEAAKMLQEVRTNYGDVVPYGEGDFVQTGDQITCDVACKVDGEEVAELSKTGFFYLMDNSFVPGFDDNLLGMNAGQTRLFEIKNGDKPFSFRVTVHMGTKKIPAPLDDELAKKAGFETFDKLQQAVDGAAGNKVKTIYQQKLQQQIIIRLLENHPFECPEWLVSMENQNKVASAGLKWEDLTDEQRESVNASSEKSVRWALILDTIRDEEPESMATDEELLNHLKRQLAQQGQDPVKVLSKANADGSLYGTVASLRNEVTMQWLVGQSKVVE